MLKKILLYKLLKSERKKYIHVSYTLSKLSLSPTLLPPAKYYPDNPDNPLQTSCNTCMAFSLPDLHLNQLTGS